MDHTIVELDPIHVIGMGIDCPGYDFSGAGDLWTRFDASNDALPKGGRVFGLSYGNAGGAYYIAGEEVPEGTAVPEGMEAALIPGGRYFKTWFNDHPSQMPAAFGRIYKEELAAAGLTPAEGGMALEEYGEDWHDEAAGKFRCWLYVQLG